MNPLISSRRLIAVTFLAALFVSSLGFLVLAREATTVEVDPPTEISMLVQQEAFAGTEAALSVGPAAPAAPCTDSPTVDGHALDQCQGTTFTVGGNTRYLSVYYTLDTSAANHWILTDTQASDVVAWMQEAYERYYEDSGREYNVGTCGGHIRAKIQKGDGWAGIAWWPNSCYIGLDAPMIRNNNGQHTTYHEIRHKTFQFAYHDCVDDWKSGYDGNADFVEGDADYGPSTIGDYGYFNSGFDPSKSMYKHGYNNRFTPYYSEHTDLHIGPIGSPGDSEYLAGGMVKHMEFCESYDDLYVERELVEAYTPYSYEEFFMNFFAANYLNAYADAATQPELHYFEDDAPGVNVGSPPLEADVSMSGGVQSWTAQGTPDKWAGKYYQIRPQAGCDFIMLEGDGENSAKLGWAMMAADTSAPSAEYSGWVGEDFSRVIAAHGANDLIGVAVVAFGHNYDYDLTATCVTPQIEILRPMNPNHVAYVGQPTSPVAFMAYIKVSSGGTPVTGIPSDWFVIDAAGDAVTVDTLYEVTKGNYLGVFIPPTKAAGTDWVDLRACLDATGVCDTNADALLYVAPGNMDMVLLHDASNSMNDVDVVGDFSRLEQAKHAAELLVMLARTGDYYGIMDFSAKDDPPGCNPNCPHDVRTIYPKTEITDPATQIPLLRAAIAGMTGRAWTNLGQGLVEAQNLVQGAPYNSNNKIVTILSDGEENINPYYDDISASIGVVVNTFGFSGDAPNDLLARIAAEKGGDFMYVPTSSGSSRAMDAARRQEMVNEIADYLKANGIPPEQADEIAQRAPASTYLPSGLALNEAYDYRQTEATGAARVAYNAYTAVEENTWKTQSSIVSEADNTLALVSSSVEAEYGGCAGWKRDVEVLMPGAGQRDWIPISPPDGAPANWDIRNSPYHDVVYIDNPITGTWKIRTKLYYAICREGVEQARSPELIVSGYLQTGKVYSSIKLDGDILLENGQGKAGEPVPLLASLLQRTGALKDAVVLALVERPGADAHWLWLRDDGKSGDGGAGDGMYGNTYHKAVLGGAYNVSMAAVFEDPSQPGQFLLRMWKGSFYMESPDADGNPDDDDIPTWWEKLYPCMDPEKYDSQKWDYDKDGLTNWEEWENGANPCDPDTDDGGEGDGSEVAGNRNPHWPNDDKVRPIFQWSLRPLNQAIMIRWNRPLSYTRMLIRITLPNGETVERDGGQDGTYTETLENNSVYTVSLLGETADGQGPPTDPITVTPKADPDPPSGSMLINYGAMTTTQRAVELYVSASDEPLTGMPSQLSGSIANEWTANNEVSAGIEMRFRNDESGDWSTWQPYTTTVAWNLAEECRSGDSCVVYAQFRDATLNESIAVPDAITYEATAVVYLPIIMKQ